MPTRGHKVLLVLEVEKGGCKKKLWDHYQQLAIGCYINLINKYT